MSPVYNFTSPLPAGDKTPFKFVVYGDLGLDPYPEATTTALHMRQEVEENNIRFIYHHGDLSYARGQVKHVFGANFSKIDFIWQQNNDRNTFNKKRLS